ncbi:hypothetical protein K469DRAFT_552030 [Zopfia rhizophila CBS 207.26]|uniref:LysM domain-containing protein n=1 Tax=Zopfia rhizophila CBS 207.26 TaxID=1314779 RepID=A0A6A6EPP6_9PEZI|nr:hypothetical protein K469DRAFT_552030 [Zopfia rhizophila CBS 207.26]
MAVKRGLLPILAALLGSASLASAACDPSSLDNSTFLYNVTVDGTTIFDIANATGRGVCDIGRQNIMANVTIVPNVGESILIPAQTCEPDNESCILKPDPNPRNCLLGGPRLYYTVRGDTFDKIALRLNMTAESIMIGTTPGNRTSTGVTNSSQELQAGSFLKIPQCEPSQCIMQPYSFKWGVYKDLAEKFGTTVGQIMMLSPTYNYSSKAFLGGSFPPITMAINCTVLSDNTTVLE